MQRAPRDGPASLSESSSSPRRRALSLSSGGSKSDDRRDDRPAALSPEPADTSRRLWPHRGRVRSTRAAILTTDRLAATTAAATAAQRREPRSRDFASSLLPFNESAAKRRPRSFIDCAVGAVRQFLDRPGRREAAGGHWLTELRSPGASLPGLPCRSYDSLDYVRSAHRGGRQHALRLFRPKP